VTKTLKQNLDYLEVYQNVFGKKFENLAEVEVNLFSRCYLRSALNWQHVVNSGSNQIIPEKLIWNAILLVETTTTELPTNFSNEFRALINKMNFEALGYQIDSLSFIHFNVFEPNNEFLIFLKLLFSNLLQQQEHFKEKSLLQKLLQMERQVLLLRFYYGLQGYENVFLILSSSSWNQTIPRMKTNGDTLLGAIFGSDNAFSRAFTNLKLVYARNQFIARGL
jgi:hypothetical protein